MNDKTSKDGSLIPAERIERSILLIRGHKVILDADLAALYGVETKQLIRAVKRNLPRFPDDFMFQLTEEEFENLRYHFGTSSFKSLKPIQQRTTSSNSGETRRAAKQMGPPKNSSEPQYYGQTRNKTFPTNL